MLLLLKYGAKYQGAVTPGHSSANQAATVYYHPITSYNYLLVQSVCLF